MEISDKKLVHGLIKNIEQLAAFAKESDGPAIIRSSQTMLLELNRRADFSRVVEHYQQGRALIAKAVTMPTDDSPQSSATSGL